ncbi:MAG TPA: hypothetical protein VL443_07390 [Cyclobacteriaceae bacterium]|jgi:hypothetical protein|nr:hypothetical protein [Cyclobacteriaceae bacterium]
MEEPIILDDQLNPNKLNNVRRRDLLPMWIKVFLWIFLVMGGFAVLGWFSGFAGVKFNTSLYGISSSEPLSEFGVALMLLFLLKAIVAFGLWTEKDWAITAGTVDAVLGIGICIFVMVLTPIFFPTNPVSHSGGVTKLQFANFNLRLELIALIPYLMKLRKINAQWKFSTGPIE